MSGWSILMAFPIYNPIRFLIDRSVCSFIHSRLYPFKIINSPIGQWIYSLRVSHPHSISKFADCYCRNRCRNKSRNKTNRMLACLLACLTGNDQWSLEKERERERETRRDLNNCCICMYEYNVWIFPYFLTYLFLLRNSTRNNINRPIPTY